MCFLRIFFTANAARLMSVLFTLYSNRMYNAQGCVCRCERVVNVKTGWADSSRRMLHFPRMRFQRMRKILLEKGLFFCSHVDRSLYCGVFEYWPSPFSQWFRCFRSYYSKLRFTYAKACISRYIMVSWRSGDSPGSLLVLTHRVIGSSPVLCSFFHQPFKLFFYLFYSSL